MENMVSKVLIFVVIPAQVLLGGSGFWHPAGNTNAIVLQDSGKLVIRADGSTTAGVISKPLNTPQNCTAVMVEASVQNANQRSLTFAVFDDNTSDCIGYWQNPRAIGRAITIATVLSFSRDKVTSIRLFAGTHSHASHAQILSFHYTFLRKATRCHNSIYGCRIDHDHTLRQTFTAEGKELDAAVILIKALGNSFRGPNLKVSLYHWQDDFTSSLQAKPLASVIIPRSRIISVENIETLKEMDTDVIATYLTKSERKLAVPLKSKTTQGQRYILELAVDNPAATESGFLTYAWVDKYPHGQLFDGLTTRGRNWDIYMELFYGL